MPTSGILQGCPWSVLITNCIMDIWAALMLALGLEFVTFIDDRAVYSLDIDAPQVLLLAFYWTQRFDYSTGALLNFTKSYSWAFSSATRKFLQQHLPFPCRPSLEFLKIPVPLTVAQSVHGLPFLRSSQVQKFFWRLRRIQIAIPKPADRHLAVRTLALPLLAWSAQWTTLSQRCWQHLRRTIELTCSYLCVGRSSALIWITQLGQHLDPFFQTVLAALRIEVRQFFNYHLHLSSTPCAGTRLPSLLFEFGWLPSGVLQFRSAMGLLDFRLLTRIAAVRLLVYAWRLHLVQHDVRFRRLVPSHVQAHHLFVEPLLHAVRLPLWYHAVVGAPVYRRASYIPCCLCAARPTRLHILWDCPCAPQPAPVGFDMRFQRSSLIPVLPLCWADISLDAWVTHPAFDVLRDRLSSIVVNPIFVATDGSADTLSSVSAAAVALQGDHQVYSVAIPTPTVDHTSFAAELWALLFIFIVATEVDRLVVLAVDSSSAIAAAVSPFPSSAAMCWAPYLRLLIQHFLSYGHQLIWVPAHGRRAAWTPPIGDALCWRSLNAAAHQAANRCMLAQRSADYLHARAHSGQWVIDALYRLATLQALINHQALPPPHERLFLVHQLDSHFY